MQEEKTDRRVRKTKAQLLLGLTRLMQEKDVKDISVKELADLVDINRGTFYLHYRDIYDMLQKTEDSLFVEFNGILDRNFSRTGEPDLHNVMRDIFTFLENNRDIAKALVGPHGDLAFINRLKTLVRTRILHLLEESRQFLPDYFEFYYSFIVSGCIGLIETWLNSEFPKPADEISEFCARLITEGVKAK